VVQTIAGSHACVPWMCVEQRSPTFSIEPLPEENIRPSVCQKTKLRARLSGPDAGYDRQILRYKLCNFVGIEIFGS
jgi:hypothetical protein